MTHLTLSHLKSLGLALVVLSAAACGPTEPAPQTSTCPDENRVLIGDHKYCVIDQSIIEKGFSCPMDLSYRHDVPGVNGAACSDQRELPKQDIEPLKDLVQDPPGSGSWLNNPEPDPMPDPDPDPVTCTTPNPADAGCSNDAECGAGESCQATDVQVCVPSSCSCESGDAWVCTEDCGELKECAPVQSTSCVGSDPSEQECAIDADCAGDQVCGFSAIEVCVPSACGCDEASGEWLCTADCGQNRACTDPEPVAPCSDGLEIICDAVAGPCPTGLIRETTDGCFGECVDPVSCESPVPMCGGTSDPSYQECNVDADCEGDAVCGISDLAVCVSSSCDCNEASGSWGCDDDCQSARFCEEADSGTDPDQCGDGTQALCNAIPGICPVGQVREVVNGCYGGCVEEATCDSPAEACGGIPDPSYQPCSQDVDCGAGNVCQPTGDAVCVPSTCFCDDPAGGVWGCTEDCGMPMGCVEAQP